MLERQAAVFGAKGEREGNGERDDKKCDDDRERRRDERDPSCASTRHRERRFLRAHRAVFSYLRCEIASLAAARASMCSQSRPRALPALGAPAPRLTSPPPGTACAI